MAKRRRKSTSRAARLSDALSAVDMGKADLALEQIQGYASALQEAHDEIAQTEPDDVPDVALPEAPTYDPKDMLGADAASAAETVQELYDEIESWHDNMSGTGLENTQKYSDLEECMNALEQIKDPLESVDFPERPATPWQRIVYQIGDGVFRDTEEEAREYANALAESTGIVVAIERLVLTHTALLTQDGVDAWESYAEEFEQARDEVQQALDAEGDVNFVGMYG